MFVVNTIYNHGNILTNGNEILERIKIGWQGIYNPRYMSLIYVNEFPRYLIAKLNDITMDITIPYDYDYNNVEVRYVKDKKHI